MEIKNWERIAMDLLRNSDKVKEVLGKTYIQEIEYVGDSSQIVAEHRFDMEKVGKGSVLDFLDNVWIPFRKTGIYQLVLDGSDYIDNNGLFLNLVVIYCDLKEKNF